VNELDKLKPLELRGEKKKLLPKKEEAEPREEEIEWIEATAEAVDMEGPVVSIDQLEGHVVVFSDVVTRPSQYGEGEYVYAQIYVKGEAYTLRTGSKPVVGAILHQVKAGKIPFRAYVEKRKGARGRTYYVLTSRQTADQEARR
jgi:hypothetical protein